MCAIKTTKPKVLHVALSWQAGGGADMVAASLVRSLRQADWPVVFAGGKGSLVAELTAMGADYLPLAMTSQRPDVIMRNAWHLARIIRRSSIDVVHVHSRSPAWSAWLATRRNSIPLVTTFHGHYRVHGIGKRFYNSVMARGDGVIAIADHMADYIGQYYPEATGRIHRIPNGIDMDNFNPGAVQPSQIKYLAKKWGIKRGQKVILFPGRLAYFKGHEWFLEAFARLDQDDVVAVFLGASHASNYGRYLRRKAKNLAVIFVEHCDNMPVAYALSDVIVSLSTRVEPFPLVILEALAMNCSLVASHQGIVPELVSSGGGYIVLIGDRDGLVKALIRALKKPPVTIRASIIRRYGLSAMVDPTFALYQRLTRL